MHLAMLALLGRAGRTEATPSAPALTVREREVLQWMREGKSDDEIAAILGLSIATVKNHTCSIYSYPPQAANAFATLFFRRYGPAS